MSPVPIEHAGPAAVDIAAHLRPALGAQLLELAVLQLDSRDVGALGDEPHLDLGADRRVRLPLAVDVPGHHEALRRLPHDDLADVGARAVLGDLVPLAAEAR